MIRRPDDLERLKTMLVDALEHESVADLLYNLWQLGAQRGWSGLGTFPRNYLEDLGRAAEEVNRKKAALDVDEREDDQ